MGWSRITSITTYSAGNAQAISVQAGEMVRIRTIRPPTGPDGEVVIYDQTGAPIQTITVSKSNPDQMTEFATTATSLNYSTTIAFDAPGLQISWQGAEATPSYDPATGNTAFGGAVVAPEIILDPITELQVPDPRRIQAVKATLIRGTIAVDIKATDELLVFGSNATTATNSMSTTLMDASITKAILTEGAALSSAMVSIPHPIGESASVIAATNAAGFAVTLGE